MKTPELSASLQRIVSGMVGSGIGLVATVAMQLAVVPIFLRTGGKVFLGEWLEFISIFLLVQSIDLGTSDAIQAEIAKRLLGHDKVSAQQFFSCGITIIGVLGIGVAVMAAFLVFGPLSGSLYPEAILGLFAAVLSLSQRLTLGCLRGIGQFGFGIALSSSARLVETLVVCITAYLMPYMSTVILAYGIARLFGTVGIIAITIRRTGIKFIPASFAETKVVKTLTSPIQGNLTMNLGIVAVNSGVILALSYISGPAVAAVFGTARTLSRIGMQISSIFTQSSSAEAAHLEFENKRESAGKTIRLALVLLVGLTGLFAVFITLFGDSIYSAWTQKIIEFDRQLVGILAVDGVMSALWLFCFNILQNRGRQKFFAAASLGICLLLPVSIVSLQLLVSKPDLLVVASMHCAATSVLAVIGLIELKRTNPKG